MTSIEGGEFGGTVVELEVLRVVGIVEMHSRSVCLYMRPFKETDCPFGTFMNAFTEASLSRVVELVDGFSPFGRIHRFPI